jgi:hypothetical protein
MQNSFSQKVILVLFFALCASGLIQFYRYMVWQANEDLNSPEAIKKAYHGGR